MLHTSAPYYIYIVRGGHLDDLEILRKGQIIFSMLFRKPEKHVTHCREISIAEG